MNLEEKLGAVEELFTRGSKSFQVAVDIVRKNRDVTMAERALMAEKVGCADSTVRYVLTKLRKAGLYGSYEPPTPQKTQEEEEPTEEEPEPEAESEEPEEKYVTIDEFNRLVEEIRILSGITPIQEEEEYVEEQYEAPPPESIDLEKATMKQYGTWVKSQNQLLFDFTKQGAFGGALEDFDGNWSDWVNLCLEDYFTVVHNVGIGLLSRRFAR